MIKPSHASFRYSWCWQRNEAARQEKNKARKDNNSEENFRGREQVEARMFSVRSDLFTHGSDFVGACSEMRTRDTRGRSSSRRGEGGTR